MQNPIYILVFTFILSFFNPEKYITATWVYSTTQNSVSVYVKQARFDYQKSGLQFKEDGAFTIRRNESDCGTPPIQYQNFHGKWTMSSDSVITTSYRYFNNKSIARKWKVVKVTQDSLLLRNVSVTK